MVIGISERTGGIFEYNIVVNRRNGNIAGKAECAKENIRARAVDEVAYVTDR